MMDDVASPSSETTKFTDSFEESDSRAGFYYDLKFLVIVMFVAFLIPTILSRSLRDTGIDVLSLLFFSLIFFLDLQEYVEVKVTRHGWKGSKSDYRVALVLLAFGVVLVPISGFLMNSGMISQLPESASIALFFLSIGFLMVPIAGLVFYLIFILNFARSHGFSLWERDKEMSGVLSKHSFIYPKLFRQKKRT